MFPISFPRSLFLSTVFLFVPAIALSAVAAEIVKFNCDDYKALILGDTGC